MNRSGGEVIFDFVIFLCKNILNFIKTNIRVVITISIIILIIFTTIMIIGMSHMRPERALNNFLRQIEDGNVYDVKLTIYFSPIMSHFPFSLRELRNRDDTLKYVVDGEQLAEHIDLFNQIRYMDLTPVERKSRVDARIYYIFENKNGRKIFDVVMWGGTNDNDSMFINGREFYYNPIFYEIISPFLPNFAP